MMRPASQPNLQEFSSRHGLVADAGEPVAQQQESHGIEREYIQSTTPL
ncbi:hypothetical protein ABU162_06570 [Paenibacillus thiaminolyticus]